MSETAMTPARQAARRAEQTGSEPEFYVPLPRRLLADMRNTPRAVGVYALVARVYRATGADVPISPTDLHAYDPALSTGAAGRALDRLESTGFLVRQTTRGRRNAYRPSWGRVGGEPRPWVLGAKGLGRPPHLSYVQLPQSLLDHYMGRLEPNDRHGAHITRYVTVPLLRLADVGAYGVALAGYAAPTAGLEAAGLLAEGLLLAPPKLAETLALASQRRLFDAGSPVALTPAGLARLGVAPAAPAAPRGEALLFLEADQAAQLIGQPIAHLIGSDDAAEPPPSASQRPRGRFAPPRAGSHGISCEKDQESTTLSTVEHQPEIGGGDRSLLTPERPAGQQPTAAPAATSDERAAPAPTPTPAHGPAGAGRPAPLSETTRLLLGIGVRGDVARQLADRPAEQVRRLISEVQRRPDIRSRAAWVVSALRSLPAEEPAVAPAVSDGPILTHPGLSHTERARWLTRFRAADRFERAEVLARFMAEHPLQADG